ncbi:RNA chaperone Hfq [Bacillus sp. JJ864]|uniref:RNA chaperone Hfq n=1 Tax=Bacillus sp. JJ864 TaxID=3122975 RepID=UPI002FFF347B
MRDLQEILYKQAIEKKKQVMIFLKNGVRLPGQIIATDKFTILIESNRQQQLIYKQAISTIV